MEETGTFCERLRADVEARCGYPIYKKLLKDGGYHLRKHEDPRGGLFAGIWRQPRKRRFKIQVREKHAIEAGVADLANRHDDNGWWNEPAAYWDVLESDHQSYNRAVEALSKICQVR